MADEATRRLMFWLKIPYLADIGLFIAGIWYLAVGDGAGWWILLFGAARAVVGTIALVFAARMIKRH